MVGSPRAGDAGDMGVGAGVGAALGADAGAAFEAGAGAVLGAGTASALPLPIIFFSSIIMSVFISHLSFLFQGF